MVIGTFAFGQHCNLATATGTANGVSVSDSDAACFFGSLSAVPVFPDISGPAPQNQIIDRLLETVALEELALAALINAEAEKVQALAAAGVAGPLEPEDLAEINRSVAEVIQRAGKKEETLRRKLSRLLAHAQAPGNKVHESEEKRSESMAESVRHLFARGNTARGVHCLYDSAFQGLSKLFLLAGSPGTGKSTLLKQIAAGAIALGESVELFHSPFSPDDLDALIIKDLQVGVADERVCLGLDAIPNVDLVRIELGPAVQPLSAAAKQEVEALHSKVLTACASAYATFATALRIHDEWEAIYISHMDFNKADQVGKELAASFFGAQAPTKRATVRHLFFGAATPQGAVDHIPTLTSHLQRRILIKGRPGSGKSTMLKRLAAAAEAKGVDVEVFHCGFDPHSLDMLIFPELSLAIFDSTAPHEYFPSQSSDEILDMYEKAITPGTDEQYATELQPIQARYKQKMQEATALLQEAHAMHLRLRSHYTACTDFAKVEQLGSQLQGELAQLARTVVTQSEAEPQ